jgi:site-specific DNA recombinase
VVIVGEYPDDAVSGTIPLAERPAGARLLADARAGFIDEVHVYRLDRLGRDLIGLAMARQALVDRGIRLISTVEGEPDEFMFDIQSAVAANERRVLLRRSADGMTEAARQGRYCGGIVPFGFAVEGRKATSSLVPDDSVIWADQSPADVVRWMYDRLALDGWSCRRIALDLNRRGVPTHYGRDGRLVKRDNRKQRTQGLWRPGRIRNLVVNPVYRGERRYGFRTAKRGRDPITAAGLPLVSPAIWHAAQATLAANRTMAKNTRRRYLLKGVINCGICGLTYCGSQGRGEVGWYRCNGQLVERGPLPGRCWGQSIRTDAVDPAVWADIERWLRDPGDVLDDLDGHTEREAQDAIVEAEAITLGRGVAALEAQRKQSISLNIRGRLGDAELDAELDRIAGERGEVERRLAALRPVKELPEPETIDLLAEVRQRLDGGLTTDQRQEIVRLLVHIVVHTSTAETGGKVARAVVTYRFPAVVETRTDRDWWRRRAGIEPAA